MKNTTAKFEVVLIEDYNENKGNPDVSSESFETLSEAEVAFENEIKSEYSENGKTCRVELRDLTENEDGEVADEPIKEGYKASALLPKDGVVVTYQHRTYMNYCYSISEVRKVNDGERYEDLNVSVDHTNSNWDAVYDSIEEMQEAFEKGFSSPMDKINSGSSKVEEFLSENNVEGYTEVEEEGGDNE